MVSLAVIFNEPAFPSPILPAKTNPPLLRVRLPVVMVTASESPTASVMAKTKLLLSKAILPEALISISPVVVKTKLLSKKILPEAFI